jgi:AbrB family looped-hinge helix DNA binding protein
MLMNALVRIQSKGQMTIPSKLRSAVGLADGDLVEVRAVGRKIVISPQLVIDPSVFPASNGEYTAAQRKKLDASLTEAEKGPHFGPFRSGAEVAAFLKQWQRNAKSAKAKRRR